MATVPDVVPAREGGISRKRPLKTFWRNVRGRLKESKLFAGVLTSVLATTLRLIYVTNRTVPGSDDPADLCRDNAPSITTFWHGQHLLAPAFKPKDVRIAALFSRSGDAELNARVAERFGFVAIRGSGGRDPSRSREKGGARALLLLKRTLEAGTNVSIIADIPHGTPREAGLGVVTLARLSGRPIVPVAVATSRRKVLERSWDKTAINLPFGRKAIVSGDPIYVRADADAEEIERMRRAVTAGLDAVTEKAYALVDRRS